MKHFLGTLIIAVGALAVACGGGAQAKSSAPSKSAPAAPEPSAERKQADAYRTEAARLVFANEAILKQAAATVPNNPALATPAQVDAFADQVDQVKANNAALRALTAPNCLFRTQKYMGMATRGIDDGLGNTLRGLREPAGDMRRVLLDTGRDQLANAEKVLATATRFATTDVCI